MEELVREIEQYQGLRALRLEGNTVGVDAARAIAKALESKDQLQVQLSFIHPSPSCPRCCPFSKRDDLDEPDPVHRQPWSRDHDYDF